MKADEFISDEEIRETLSYAEKNKDNIELIDSIIEKAKLRKGLNHREASVLLACRIPEKVEEMYRLGVQDAQAFLQGNIPHAAQTGVMGAQTTAAPLETK